MTKMSGNNCQFILHIIHLIIIILCLGITRANSAIVNIDIKENSINNNEKDHTKLALNNSIIYPYQYNLAYQFFYIMGSYNKSIETNTTSKIKTTNREIINQNYKNDNDLIYNDMQCDQDIKKITTDLYDYHQWAIEFPDSWGRMPMGLMWGHTISMGQFEECLAIKHKIPEKNHIIQGQYCLAKVPIKSFIDKIIKNVDRKERISYLKTEPEYFELGICVPSSCSPEKTNLLLKKVINTLFGQNINGTMINKDFCKIDQPITLRGIDIFAITFFVLIIFCMLASSIYDYIKTKNGESKKELFMAFSVITNSKNIFTVKTLSENPNIIQCLNGIRCFSMMWVVFGHGYMTFYDLPHINKSIVYKWVENPYSMLVQNGSLCVDTFFFMSGLLVLWGTFREMEKTKGRLNIPMMYFHRYIRLTPVVAVVILYIMSLYKYSGAGPMWMKLGTQDKRCENTWWATLLYVQNYVYPTKICVSQSWYLAVDTQLYVISPLFVIPLWKWGKKALIPIGIIILLCMVCTFSTFMVNDFTLFRVQDTHVDLRQRLTYYPTHTRIPSWLIGVIFGYFLFTENRGRKIPLGKRWIILGWLTAIGIMLVDIWGPFWRILPQNRDAPIIEGAFYEPLSRVVWALAICWIVWACYNGHGGVINEFLSWSFFTVFSRLTYCMYLIHRIVQLVTAARLQTDTHYSDYDAILRWWHDFGIALTLSIFATLAFESPILGIEKALFTRKQNSQTTKNI